MQGKVVGLFDKVRSPDDQAASSTESAKTQSNDGFDQSGVAEQLETGLRQVSYCQSSLRLAADVHDQARLRLVTLDLFTTDEETTIERDAINHISAECDALLEHLGDLENRLTELKFSHQLYSVNLDSEVANIDSMLKILPTMMEDISRAVARSSELIDAFNNYNAALVLDDLLGVNSTRYADFV